jgi:hypothetical protein
MEWFTRVKPYPKGLATQKGRRLHLLFVATHGATLNKKRVRKLVVQLFCAGEITWSVTLMA